jgi:hypothetical protein
LEDPLTLGPQVVLQLAPPGLERVDVVLLERGRHQVKTALASEDVLGCCESIEEVKKPQRQGSNGRGDGRGAARLRINSVP